MSATERVPGPAPATDIADPSPPPIESLLEQVGRLRSLTEQLETDCRQVETGSQRQERDQGRLRRAVDVGRQRGRRLLAELRASRKRVTELESRLSDEETDAIKIKKEKLQILLRELESKREECTQLQQTQEALAEEIASQRTRLQCHDEKLTPSLDSMTWEQRKQLIVDQLEREDVYPSEERTRLIDVLAETERVIRDRDTELAELRELLKQQSQTRADTEVVGAASIAAMLDADPLIQEERAKLDTLKREWEDRIKQSEIECSFERARLARERRELQGYAENG